MHPEFRMSIERHRQRSHLLESVPETQLDGSAGVLRLGKQSDQRDVGTRALSKSQKPTGDHRWAFFADSECRWRTTSPPPSGR
jgi:hypothetical protein